MTGVMIRTMLRHAGRDKPVSLAVLRAQPRAVARWDRQQPETATFTSAALILHGDSARMVPVGNADALVARFQQAEVRFFADSGHGVVFQNRQAITKAVGQFLRR